MSVTLVEVMGAARCRRAALAAEVAGYVVLLAADQISAAPRRVSAADVVITEDGSVRLVGGSAADARAAEAALRELLDELLLVASSGSAALLRAARRDAAGSAERLIAELEVALIPANRSAARRALARLSRETIRARGRGQAVAGTAAENPPRAPQRPVRVAPPDHDLPPPVMLVPASVHSPTPVVVAPEALNTTPAPVTPVLTARLIDEKTQVQRTQPLVFPPRRDPAAPQNEGGAMHEEPVPLQDELVEHCEEPVVELYEEPVVELYEEPVVELYEEPVVELCEEPIESEPGTRPEPVVLRRAAGASALSVFPPAALAVTTDIPPEAELTDPMPAMALPTPSPAFAGRAIWHETPTALPRSATPSPSAVEFLLVDVKARPEPVEPVSPRFQRSDMADLLERFRVTEEHATDICRDLKAFAGVDGTNAPPSVTPPPIETSALDESEDAAGQPSAQSSQAHKTLLGALLALVLVAGIGSAVRRPFAERATAAAAAAESCRASLVVEHAPAGARVVVRPAAADSELSRRVGRGPVATFEGLPCGEALEVVVEDMQAGERRWRRIPVAASELMPAAGAANVALEVTAAAQLAAR